MQRQHVRWCGRRGFPSADFAEALSFPLDVPREDNPTGCYRTTFEVPEGWAGRQVFIRFEGVDSGFHLWINGKAVGYNQGSRLPAELQHHAVPEAGRRTLAAEVYRWTDGSYLEDQDFWRLSGIYGTSCSGRCQRSICGTSPCRRR